MGRFEKKKTKRETESVAKIVVGIMIFWLISLLVPGISVAAQLIWHNSFTLFLMICAISVWVILTIIMAVIAGMSYKELKKYADILNEEDE